MLRSSVHWKKIKQPVLVVRPEKELNWTVNDFSDFSEIEQNEAIDRLKNTCKTAGIDFEGNPLTQVNLIKKDESTFSLLWNCHHLFLDGWSSTIILKDVIHFYASEIENTSTSLETIPSLKSYYSWIEQMETTKIEHFWKDTFNDFKKASLFAKGIPVTTTVMKHVSRDYKGELLTQLKKYAQSNKTTMNSVLQGLWTVLLAKHFDTKDVTFGSTVSGRSGDFPKIDSMAGMFSNVVPLRASIGVKETFQEITSKIQLQQQQARKFEHITLNQIASWTDRKENNILFDSLFVYENFPWNDIANEHISISNFKSGITTTYPITVIFKTEEHITCDIIFNEKVIPHELSEWFLSGLSILIEHLISGQNTDYDSLIAALPDSIAITEQEILSTSNLPENQSYEAPHNQLQMKLVAIWEQLFDLTYISIHDNFFLLGGKSFLAVKMFALLEEKVGKKYLPTVLLEHPTIAQLSAFMEDTTNEVVWKNLVPIRSHGEKTPIFAIHAGGAHVFFFKPLADSLNPEIPIYALQPSGMYSEDDLHQSIEEMAIDYANEVMLAQPEGTINFLIYCFSSAVGLAMASYLKTKERSTHIMVMDTMPVHDALFDKDRFKIRALGFIERLLKNPFNAIKLFAISVHKHRIKPTYKKVVGSEAAKKTERMRVHLVKLFNNYGWKDRTDHVSILISEKPNSHFNASLEKSWDDYCDHTPQIAHSSYQHGDLFDYPAVERTAEALEGFLKP